MTPTGYCNDTLETITVLSACEDNRLPGSILPETSELAFLASFSVCKVSKAMH